MKFAPVEKHEFGEGDVHDDLIQEDVHSAFYHGTISEQEAESMLYNLNYTKFNYSQ